MDVTRRCDSGCYENAFESMHVCRYALIQSPPLIPKQSLSFACLICRLPVIRLHAPVCSVCLCHSGVLVYAPKVIIIHLIHPSCPPKVQQVLSRFQGMGTDRGRSRRPGKPRKSNPSQGTIRNLPDSWIQDSLIPCSPRPMIFPPGATDNLLEGSHHHGFVGLVGPQLVIGNNTVVVLRD
jgi:hypothetical protein